MKVFLIMVIFNFFFLPICKIFCKKSLQLFIYLKNLSIFVA